MKHKIITIMDTINNAKSSSAVNAATAERAEVLNAIHPSLIWGGIITLIVFLFFALQGKQAWFLF